MAQVLRGVDHADRIQRVGEVFTMTLTWVVQQQPRNRLREGQLLAWKTAPAGRASRLGIS